MWDDKAWRMPQSCRAPVREVLELGRFGDIRVGARVDAMPSIVGKPILPIRGSQYFSTRIVQDGEERRFTPGRLVAAPAK